MSIEDRLADADVLWTYGHREGALFSTVIAASALARSTYPDLRDGEAFRTLLLDHSDWGIEVEHRGRQVSIEQLLWKWVRCEMAHVGALPLDVQFFDTDDDPDDLRIQAGGAPDYCVRISDGWYWWLRRIVSETSDISHLPTPRPA